MLQQRYSRNMKQPYVTSLMKMIAWFLLERHTDNRA